MPTCESDSGIQFHGPDRIENEVDHVFEITGQGDSETLHIIAPDGRQTDIFWAPGDGMGVPCGWVIRYDPGTEQCDDDPADPGEIDALLTTTDAPEWVRIWAEGVTE